jgi:DnaJ family protein C protein 9
MSFLEELSSLFGTQGLYEILGVEKTASEAEIKKAYRRLSLKVHPDRVSNEQKDLATQKFQAVSKVHLILTNKDLRAVYDETGEVGEEMIEQERDWLYYWRVLFPKITAEDIKKFEKQYKGSDEELKDLKSAYVKCEGDMDGILDNVMCSTIDDEPRFREILQNAIDNNELPAFDNFTKEDKRKKRARKQKV